MNTKIRVALDIETLSLRPDAVVMQVGLAAWTQRGGLVASMGMFIDRTAQTDRRQDKTTVDWWDQQPPEAKAVLAESLSPLAAHPASVAPRIAGFLDGLQRNGEIEGIYGYGSDFDNVTLQDLCAAYSSVPPWHYRLNRCGRTIAGLCPEIEKPITEGVKHNAVDDAVWLATYLRRCFMKLGID